MKISGKKCFICGCSCMQQSTVDYVRCMNCGHEVLRSTKEQGFIVNDHLSEKEMYSFTGLDRFKAQTLAFFDSDLFKGRLLDIGSASGKFLHQNGGRYMDAIGIEITPESLTFSKRVLGLKVVESIESVEGAVNIATAWHSLEHVPEERLIELLQGLADKLCAGGRLVVSVPNAASRQYSWFKRSYAYYDVPNHLHQFTPKSLGLLMSRFGMSHVADVSSTIYNIFGYVQGLLNITTLTHNYLYYRAKRKSLKSSLVQDSKNALLLAVLLPIGCLLGLLDSKNLKRQGVITACFQKDTC